MPPPASGESADAGELLRRAAAGDVAAWGNLLVSHERRLCRIAAFRLDPRLRGRVDASDVVQDAYAEAADHRAGYFDQSAIPLFLWLRGIVANKLLEVHRHHLGTQMRDAAREAMRPFVSDGATSAAVVEQLTGHGTGPKTAATRSEARGRLRGALDAMDPTDREVLALRHFEQLSNAEAAEVLGIRERAAAKRYLRALGRLKDILAEMPGGLAEVRP